MGSDSISKPSEHEEVLEKLQTGQIDILIGTQMWPRDCTCRK